MKQAYETYDEITRELLDGVKCGDLIMCNDWRQALRVIAVSENYFLMARRVFGKTLYSVCEKKPAGYSRNNFTAGFFRIGRDNYVFGSPNGYDWHADDDANAYLADFESGEVELSERAAVNLRHISIKRQEAKTE